MTWIATVAVSEMKRMMDSPRERSPTEKRSTCTKQSVYTAQVQKIRIDEHIKKESAKEKRVAPRRCVNTTPKGYIHRAICNKNDILALFSGPVLSLEKKKIK